MSNKETNELKNGMKIKVINNIGNNQNFDEAYFRHKTLIIDNKYYLY